MALERIFFVTLFPKNVLCIFNRIVSLRQLYVAGKYKLQIKISWGVCHEVVINSLPFNDRHITVTLNIGTLYSCSGLEKSSVLPVLDRFLKLKTD